MLVFPYQLIVISLFCDKYPLKCAQLLINALGNTEKVMHSCQCVGLSSKGKNTDPKAEFILKPM